MRNTWKTYLLWLAFGGALVGAGLVCCHMLGCADTEKTVKTVPVVADAEHCWDDISTAIAQARTCPLAILAVTDLVRKSPECSAVMSVLGITLVCHEDAPADGGAHVD